MDDIDKKLISASDMTSQEALDCLKFQLEMGASESVAETPVDRFDLLPPELPQNPSQGVTEASSTLPSSLARNCNTLEDFYQTIHAYKVSPLVAGAQQAVICDGNPKARVMIIGEAPGAEEDRLGLPFTGPSGKLLDRALAHIGLDRKAENPEDSFYITNVVYWRPPDNRNPSSEEIAPLMPFCEKHIALVNPEILLLLGNIACQNLLRVTTGITKLRGDWKFYTPPGSETPIPVMPSFHTAYLLRSPGMKRLFWQDILALKIMLEEKDSEKNEVQPT